MVSLPPAFLDSLETVPGFDRAAFEQVHLSGDQVTSIRINPSKWNEADARNYAHLPIHDKVPWSAFGYYISKRPSFTFDPLFHAGCYYVQEASSMFLEWALRQTLDLTHSLRVLDLCGAPGGKSTHIQSLLCADSLLVTNEVIRKRVPVLIDNVTRWGAENVIVTGSDPKKFGSLTSFFDAVVVDAPCSGSGLFRRDPGAINEWSLQNVALCSQRQQRILSDVLGCLKEGGVLIYSTCSYSTEEDEAIGDWLVKEWDLEPVKLHIDEGWGIIETNSDLGSIGYRFFPDKIRGEGFFLSCFRKRKGVEAKRSGEKKGNTLTEKELTIVKQWTDVMHKTIFRSGIAIYAIPEKWEQTYSRLDSMLNILYAGVEIGELFHQKLVPAHALALSQLVGKNVPLVDLDYEQSIKFLQKSDLSIPLQQTGWQRVAYQNRALGWINALPNRINNNYPKELRILKQSNDSGFAK